MSQNLVSVSFSEAQLAAVDESLQQLEAQLTGLVALTVKQRRSATKMGPKSEAFCRQTLGLLDQNPNIVPPSLSLTEARSDLTSIDQLRPRLQRLARLSERANDTEFALRNDVMRAALQGYALLKVVGRNQGLEALRKTIGSGFSRGGRQPEEAIAA